MNELQLLRKTLQQHANPEKSGNIKIFFKNSQNDIFLGVGAAVLRQIAKSFHTLDLDDVLILLKSDVHDERSVANMILCHKFKKGDEQAQAKLFKYYIKHRHHIRDWDGVDGSAPYIAGPYLIHRDKAILYKLAKSKMIWDRRIAIVTTWYFIRQGLFADTLKLAEILFEDQEDLIHKAVGWMLREVGKKDELLLRRFLNKHHHRMPRTTLRYAIEKFAPADRKNYLLSV